MFSNRMMRVLWPSLLHKESGHRDANDRDRKRQGRHRYRQESLLALGQNEDDEFCQ